MSQAEHPDRTRPDHEVTVEDVRQLTGASTPHFALQLRNRIARLRKLGTVKRIAGPDPVRNAIAFARYIDGTFGWGVVDPGHGLVFVNRNQPLAAAAAAPLSASGTYGPALVLDSPTAVPRPLAGYLLDIQPGYRKNPVRGVYNHAWVIGDERAMSAATQARIDGMLEIVPVERQRSTS